MWLSWKGCGGGVVRVIPSGEFKVSKANAIPVGSLFRGYISRCKFSATVPGPCQPA